MFFNANFVVMFSGTGACRELLLSFTVPHDPGFRGKIQDRRYQDAHFRQSKLR